MSGISVQQGTGVVINGVRVDMVADHAIGMAKGAQTDKIADVRDGIVSGFDLTAAERDIADRASRVLLKMRRDGYLAEHCRNHFWRLILDEAGKVASGVEH